MSGVSLAVHNADIHWRIDSSCPSRPCSEYSIIIGRGTNGLDGYVAFYVSDHDAMLDNRITLDVWDRDSFREAYRHARIWCQTGIGQRALQSAGGPR